MNILEWVSEFKRKVVASGNEIETAKTYGNHISLFLAYYEKKYDSPLHITFRDMEDYVIYLVEEDYSPSYINSFIASVKRFYHINGQTQKCSKLEYRDNPIQSPNVLTYDECISMCEAKINIKHSVVINMLFYGGFRRQELINLQLQDISSDGRITILNGKFGKSRIITIPPNVIELLKQYLLEWNPNQYLLNGEGSKLKYSAGSIRNIISDTAVKCGIHKRTYPHLMRSSMATILLDNGASLDYVSEWLGHEKCETTHKYYHKLTIQARQNQFEEVLNKLKKSKALQEITYNEFHSKMNIAEIEIHEKEKQRQLSNMYFKEAQFSPEKQYEILFNNKTYLLKEKNDKITHAPEGVKWSIGVVSKKALEWFHKKGATITEI